MTGSSRRPSPRQQPVKISGGTGCTNVKRSEIRTRVEPAYFCTSPRRERMRLPRHRLEGRRLMRKSTRPPGTRQLLIGHRADCRRGGLPIVHLDVDVSSVTATGISVAAIVASNRRPLMAAPRGCIAHRQPADLSPGTGHLTIESSSDRPPSPFLRNLHPKTSPNAPDLSGSRRRCRLNLAVLEVDHDLSIRGSIPLSAHDSQGLNKSAPVVTHRHRTSREVPPIVLRPPCHQHF